MSQKKRNIKKIFNEIKKYNKLKNFPKIGSLVTVITKSGNAYDCIFQKNMMYKPVNERYTFSRHEIKSWKYKESIIDGDQIIELNNFDNNIEEKIEENSNQDIN